MTDPRQTPLTPDTLRDGWSPRRVGRTILVVDETESTNTLALAAARNPAKWLSDHGLAQAPVDGLAVLAEYQHQGRGRHGRLWTSPRGASVLCSVLLIDEPAPAPSEGSDAPDAQVRTGGWLTLAAAVAACSGIRDAANLTPSIKWPNDLRLGGRKVGGILVESTPLPGGHRAWVVGLGINCLQHAGHFPQELRDTATSLDLQTPRAIDRGDVARSLLRALDIWLAEPPADRDTRVHEEWSRLAEAIGQRVHLRSEGREVTGSILAVDPIGGLVVQTDHNTREWFDPLRTMLL